jgi:hypothetical protein
MMTTMSTLKHIVFRVITTVLYTAVAILVSAILVPMVSSAWLLLITLFRLIFGGDDEIPKTTASENEPPQFTVEQLRTIIASHEASHLH